MFGLYLISTAEAKRLPEQTCEELFPNRMQRVRRIVRQEERTRSIGAGALLHGLLGIAEKDLRTSEHGKPYAPTSSVFFNLSHSGSFSLLATDNSEIGADIEIMDSSHVKLANEVLLPEELEWMQAEKPERRFLTLWTLKESVMKQQGLGFALPPKSFSVMPLLQQKPISVNGTLLYAASTEYDRHVISVCTAHPLPQLSPITVTAEQIFSLHK